MSKLDLPSRKMSMESLVPFKRIDNTAQAARGAELYCWRHPSYSALVETVWLQGNVTAVTEDASGLSFLLDDTSGIARILKVESTASRCPTPAIGMYMMVTGQLIETGNEPVIRAMKIHDLSGNEPLKKMWLHEVYMAAQKR